MASIELNKYRIQLDDMNATLYKKYQAKDKDGKLVDREKVIGYYSPNVLTGPLNALNAIIKDELAGQDVMTAMELMEFMTINKEQVQSWIAEQFS